MRERKRELSARTVSQPSRPTTGQRHRGTEAGTERTQANTEHTECDQTYQLSIHHPLQQCIRNARGGSSHSCCCGGRGGLGTGGLAHDARCASWHWIRQSESPRMSRGTRARRRGGTDELARVGRRAAKDEKSWHGEKNTGAWASAQGDAAGTKNRQRDKKQHAAGSSLLTRKCTSKQSCKQKKIKRRNACAVGESNPDQPLGRRPS